MKFILLTILSTIIIFFVWNILKRLFFTKFYNFNTPQNADKKENRGGRVSQKVNWDAETVDYEEVKETKKNS
ncbi:hypothetical protein [Chryseobacterium sp. MFBS3-17]|uniref:hypothetical protein n=1 Tax=Chryseobacterium sp. MFBS3-17 TaxID=2886689 RepID=UPI001D0F4711|nr:hypothetical protein [Chryseobacterium sp. MFBS3-17]MCC2590222.1 hypothetical protein [Chryseobacterium sp. MFBS3-17]